MYHKNFHADNTNQNSDIQVIIRTEQAEQMSKKLLLKYSISVPMNLVYGNQLKGHSFFVYSIILSES